MDLGRRQQTLSERRFGAEQRAIEQHQKDLQALEGYDVNNIDEAPARVLAAIDKSSAVQLLRMNQARKAGANVSGKPADLVYFDEMQREAREKGIPIEQTDRWKFKMTGKSGEKSESEIKRLIYNNLLKGDPTFSRQPKDKQEEALDNAYKIITKPQDSATGDPLLDRTLNEFNARKQRELTDSLFIGHVQDPDLLQFGNTQ